MQQKSVQTYQELTAYKAAFDAAMSLYWLLPKMLVEEGDLLEQRLIEDSRSICALLAEAWETRRYYKAFVAKLNEVEMKVAAVQTWLAFAIECGYLEIEAGQGQCDCYRFLTEKICELKETALDWSIEMAA